MERSTGAPDMCVTYTRSGGTRTFIYEQIQQKQTDSHIPINSILTHGKVQQHVTTVCSHLHLVQSTIAPEPHRAAGMDVDIILAKSQECFVVNKAKPKARFHLSQ